MMQDESFLYPRQLLDPSSHLFTVRKPGRRQTLTKVNE